MHYLESNSAYCWTTILHAIDLQSLLQYYVGDLQRLMHSPVPFGNWIALISIETLKRVHYLESNPT
jgi:hypothetical protein